MAWWKEAVIYQIYPRSFQDSNGDGIGDLEGIIQRLDYLAGSKDSLGIDAIWLSPVYPSPMFDFGYDISNYEEIDPVYGDIQTFKRLLKEAHKRGIRIIMDLVVNHTSHLHPWFIESRSSVNSPKRDWYIWKEPNHNGPPNNWLGAFGGSGWEYDKRTGEYYFHSFLKEQPDLNWRNPDVEDAIFRMMKYWLDMGVDGFRLDVVNLYVKDEFLRNNASYFMKGPRPYDKQVHAYDRDRPEMHGILRRMRKLLDSYDEKRMFVGEIMQDFPGNVLLPATYCGRNDELHLAFNFMFLFSPWKAERFYQIVKDFESALGEDNWPNYTLSNHDFPRHITRYEKGADTIARAKLAACMMLTLRGTPFLYYGEEIGMKRQKVSYNKIQDPVGKRYWPFHPGRDPERIPMPWDGSESTGFTTGKAWLPLYEEKNIVNVEKQKEDPNSLFFTYKKLIQIRKDRKSLRKGKLKILLSADKQVLYYRRRDGKEETYVFLNFSSKPVSVSYPRKWILNEILFSSNNRISSHELEKELDTGGLLLLPNEAVIFGK
ncbi:glycoside hydrolase family 13 protein [Leptospira bandrabouensis]|uniref:Alpha-glucosidase n=1 Tax=Leptospira bandrabouensis TaxID=2484903 RepID=A0A6H3NS21_9LEPT|nr:alpha-glucosidase [Leptospira bandrabouensis]MCG6144049.1 alpha-glucosidase [Leptospira bandrabouensis]MCG6150910.1 alpha-glucosidase [Leptospira bandrabouensis]MCG6159710.1 alpha-glucosidase [Leptospira bandrabouensis]MCG6163643.1 alpha-glucosidase [Leptospira bandrabouensis]TGN05274.1 alpha-glucosidase [Leptospira bandrabouensis]